LASDNPTSTAKIRHQNIERHNTLVGEILLAINPRFGIFWKNETGAAYTNGRMIRYGLVGSADILGCMKSLFVAIEVKTGSGKLSDFQKNFKAAVEKNGGIFIEGRSVEQVLRELGLLFTRNI
jgi:hypothetical protein